MQEETFVRKDMAEYKNMMNGVHNVTSCNNSVSLEKSSESNKKIFYDEKISKASKSSCSNVNICADTSGDNSTDKTIDPVSLSSKLPASRYNNNNASNGNVGNTSNYWINGKSNKMVQKKLNADITVEEGNHTGNASANCNNTADANYNNKVDTGKYMGENKSGKIQQDGNTNSTATSTNMEQVLSNNTSVLKGNMGTHKGRKNEEDNTSGVDCEVKLNGDINNMSMARKTPKNNVINETSNDTMLNTVDEKGSDNLSNNRSGSFSNVERNKDNETTEAVLDANYISSLKNANGKAGANFGEGVVCNVYMNSGNMHHEENMSNGCANLGNDNPGNEMENGNTFRGGFKGSAKMCGNEKPTSSVGNGINSTHTKGVSENEAKHMNGDVIEKEKNCEDVDNKTNNDIPNVEKNGGADFKNHSSNSKSRNSKNANNSNVSKKENDYKNKNSTLSSESGNSLSEVHNSSYKLNSASSNSYHNISSISSLNADAPEFVPSTKSAQNNLPFNNFLWSNYYQELSSPFNSVSNSSVITPAGHAAAAGTNAAVTGNATGAVHNSLIGASVDIGNSLLNTGVRDGGGTGDENATNANLLNAVNSNSTSDNNSMSLNSTNLSAPGNSTGIISSTTGGMMNRGESSSAKHNSNILSSNRTVVGGSANSGIVGNMVSVSGMKHNMHENNVTTSAANNTTTSTTNGGMGNSPNMDGVSGIGSVANVGGSGVPTVGHMPNLHNSPTVNSPQAMHNSPTIVAAVTGGGGNSQSNCNFMNPNLIHSSNNLRTTSFMSGSENSAPFHHMGNTPHAHQNFQPNSSLMHPPNVCVNSSYLLNNHHSTIPAHQPVMFTPPMSYGNSLPSSSGHPEIPFPQAASMYGAFPNSPNPNVMGNNSLTSHKNAGLNMAPYNFLPCVMPPHPQMQPNGPMNMNSMEHHCIGNSANAHMKIPYNHGNQSNRKNMFNHFSSSAGGNSNVAGIHSGTNISEANFEHGNNMAMMGGNMNYGFSSFGANQSNSMHMNNENSNMHMSPAVGNNIPLNNSAGVICLGAPLHMNTTGNMPPPHHHMSNVSSIGNMGSIGSTSSLNGSMHVGNMHMNHNMMLNNNTNMNKQKKNISYSERNKQYNNYRDNKNTVKNNMMSLNSAVGSFNHFNNTGSTDTYGNQNALNNRNIDNNNMGSSSANNTTNNIINTSGSNNGSGIGGNNNAKQENKKHNKYSGSSGFNQNYNMNNAINNVSSNTKNTYAKNMKGDNSVSNSGNNNREENNNSANGTLNYYHRNSANNALGGVSVHTSGMSLKEANTDSKELNDNFNEHNNSAYNNEGSYSNKGKNYNMNNVSSKNKGMNSTNNNASAVSSGTNTRVGNMMNSTINNMNHMFSTEGMNEKGRHNNVNMEGDKNKDEHKSNRNNYRNNSCSNNTKNNMRNSNINHSEFSEEKSGAAMSKRGEMGKEKNNKHNESNYKKSYNEMGSAVGSMSGVVVNGNSNEQNYGNKFQNNTENKRNARSADNNSGNNNKMNDKKMKNEEDKKSRKKNNVVNINNSGVGHVMHNNADNENVNKIGIENNVNTNSSDMTNGNNADFNNNNSNVTNKGGSYNIKNNKGYDRKTGEFGSWAKIAKMNLNKKKEKISNVNANMNNVDNSSGGGRNQNTGNNNSSQTNNNANNAVDAVKEKDRERGYVHSGKGGETSFTQNEVMNKDRQRKNEDDKERDREREGQQKNARKNQEDKFESNVRNKKFGYSNNKDYNIEKDMKEKQKSKYESRKAELNERKMNHSMHNNNVMNNMANDVNTTGGGNHTNRTREKVKIQNVEIKEIDEKFLNSIKSDEVRLGKKNNEHKNIGSATVNYSNENRAEGCSDKTQVLNTVKNKEMVEKEKGKDSDKVKEKEKEKEKLNSGEGIYQNGKVQGGTTLTAVKESASNKNEELSLKREGPAEATSANPRSKEGCFSSQDNKWNKSTENVSKKSNSGVSLNKDTSNKGSNNSVSNNVNGSVPVYDRVSSSNNSAKNSIWEGKTSFAEVAKRRPQRGMREVKSESVINDGKNSNANKNDKGSRKEHSRYSSNATMREKGSRVGAVTGDHVASSKEAKKRNNEDKEERVGTQMNNVESPDQEKESVSANAPKIVKEKQGSDDVMDNVKVQKESGTNVPIGESKDKLNELKGSSKGSERREWKDGKDNKFKSFKNERKEKNKEIEEEKEKWEKEKEKEREKEKEKEKENEKGTTTATTATTTTTTNATAYPSRGSNKINNVEVNIGEYKFNDKEKTSVVKNKEDSVNVNTTVEENVDSKKENGQDMESSEDISKKKKKKKKSDNEEETKMTEVEDIKKKLSIENKESEKEEKKIIDVKNVDRVEETQTHVLKKKEMEVKKTETKEDVIKAPIEKEYVEQEVTEVTHDLKLKEEGTRINKDAANNMVSTDAVAIVKESEVKLNTEQVQVEAKENNETVVLKSKAKVADEEKVELKKIDQNVTPKEDTLWAAPSKIEKIEQKENVQGSTETNNEVVKEVTKVNQSDKREDDLLARLEKKKNQLERQKDEVTSDKCIKEQETEGKEKCNMSTTNTTTDNSDNTNSNEAGQQVNGQDTNPDDVAEKDNKNSKKGESDKKGEKDGESGEKDKEEQDSRIAEMRMRIEKKYTKNELLLIYVSHNWKKEQHGYFEPHDLEWFNTFSNYAAHKNFANISGGNNNKINSNNIRDSEVMRNSLLMSSDFKNMNSNGGGYLSGNSNMVGNNANNIMKNNHGNTSSAVNMNNMNNNNNNTKRYVMNLGRTSTSSVSNLGGDEEGDWRKNSVAKNIMNNLFSNVSSNNILFNNRALGSNMMLDPVGQSSSGMSNNIAGNLLIKNINTSSDWRKNDGEKLKGFFDATRVKDSVGTWRKSTPTKTIESSWLAKQNKLKEDQFTSLMRKLRGILNRLTFEKFDLLFEELIKINFTKNEEIIGLLKLVFEKAVSQHHFVQMYVQLCVKLSNHFLGKKLEDDDKFCFRKLLINQCQDSFESYLKPIEYPSNMDEDDKFEYEQKYKNKVRGNMIFVGELVKAKIMSVPVAFLCINELLIKRENYIKEKQDTNVGNLHLEALCMFLNTIGELIDVNEKIKKENEQMISNLYDTLNKLVNDENIIFRVRCLIKDVIENRNEKWNKKFAHKLEGPTTLSDLHEKVMKETIDHNTRSSANNNMGGNNMNYHDRLNSNLNNMRNNLLRGNFMNNNNNYMNNNNNNNTSGANNANNNMNSRGIGGMKGLDGMKNMKKMAMNLCKNKPATKLSEENKSGANDSNANNNNSSGTNSYYDLMAKSHLGDFGRGAGFLGEGTDSSHRNVDSSRMMGIGSSNANNSNNMGKDKGDGMSFSRIYNMNKVNELMRRNDIRNNSSDPLGDMNVLRSTNASNENNTKLNFMNRNIKDNTATTTTATSNTAAGAHNENKSKEEEGKKKEMTEEAFEKNIFPEIEHVIQVAAGTDDWESLTKQFEEINIPPQFQEKANDAVLKFTLKKFACCQNLEKSVDFFNWIIGSIVMQHKYLSEEAFKKSWKTFMLCEERGYEFMKEDYPLLPTIIKNFVNKIEQLDEKGNVFDSATVQEMKNIIKNDISMNNDDEDDNNI